MMGRGGREGGSNDASMTCDRMWGGYAPLCKAKNWMLCYVMLNGSYDPYTYPFPIPKSAIFPEDTRTLSSGHMPSRAEALSAEIFREMSSVFWECMQYV